MKQRRLRAITSLGKIERNKNIAIAILEKIKIGVAP